VIAVGNPNVALTPVQSVVFLFSRLKTFIRIDTLCGGESTTSIGRPPDRYPHPA
jgi:hypothetical protein